MITVKSLDDLLDHGVDMLMEDVEPGELKLPDNFTFTIKVCGDTWDDTIDYRTAHFILDLQKAVNRLYVEIHGDAIPLKSLNKLVTVKVRVEKGSLTYNIDLGKVLEAMVGNMTGGETLIMTGIVAGSLVASYGIKKVLDYKERVAKRALDAEKEKLLVDRFTSTIDKALDVIQDRDIEAPPRKLINRLSEGDTITLPDGDQLPVAEAKRRYPRKPRAKKLSGLFDAAYTITNINLHKRPAEFTISNNGLEFPAAAELAPGDIEQISRDLEQAMIKGEALHMDLHVFMVYNERKMISAAIQGTGKPRENSESVQKLIEMW